MQTRPRSLTPKAGALEIQRLNTVIGPRLMLAMFKIVPFELGGNRRVRDTVGV